VAAGVLTIAAIVLPRVYPSWEVYLLTETQKYTEEQIIAVATTETIWRKYVTAAKPAGVNTLAIIPREGMTDYRALAKLISIDLKHLNFPKCIVFVQDASLASLDSPLGEFMCSDL
jgi:hypothetical protein